LGFNYQRDIFAHPVGQGHQSISLGIVWIDLDSLLRICSCLQIALLGVFVEEEKSLKVSVVSPRANLASTGGIGFD